MRTILSTLTLSLALASGTPAAQADSYAPALFGAILGGVVGHQLAHGHHPRTGQTHSAPSYRPVHSHRPVHYWQGYDERQPSYEAPVEDYYDDYDYEDDTSWDWEE